MLNDKDLEAICRGAKEHAGHFEKAQAFFRKGGGGGGIPGIFAAWLLIAFGILWLLTFLGALLLHSLPTAT